MRELSAARITEAVARLCIEANTCMPASAEAALRAAREAEPWPAARGILEGLCSNLDIARATRLPICQDTGLVTVFLELGLPVAGGVLYPHVVYALHPQPGVHIHGRRGLHDARERIAHICLSDIAFRLILVHVGGRDEHNQPRAHALHGVGYARVQPRGGGDADDRVDFLLRALVINVYLRLGVADDGIDVI